MNNTEYYDAAEKRIKKLMELRKQGISLAKGIIGETLFKEDFFFCASADRSLNLIDGFADMLRKRNLTCVGALLRLQMDNCMRSYAAFIAKDKEAVIDCIIDGNPINKQVSKDGTKMTDGYLKGELSKIDTRFADVYNQASDILFFLVYAVIAKRLGKNSISFSDIKGFDIDTLTHDEINGVKEIVYRKYKELGGNGRVAKSSSFVDEVDSVIGL